MKSIDMRFDENIIKSWVSSTFKQYKCDAFDFTNSVTQIVDLFIDDDLFTLTNIQETVDYFGNDDDIAVFRLSKSKPENLKSAFIESGLITTPINGEITKIALINENQKVRINSTRTIITIC